MFDLDLDFSLILFNLLRLGLAFLIALPIGWEREKATRIMGLRTFPLVAIGTCAFVLVGEDIAQGDPQARSRIVQGLMAGLGFIGGGAILKREDRVKGTATAASVWGTGAVGAAVGFGRGVRPWGSAGWKSRWWWLASTSPSCVGCIPCRTVSGASRAKGP